MNNILIAPDKFKGCLSAPDVVAALARGFQKRFPEAVIEKLPLADGGEGTADTLCEALGGQWLECASRDALGRPIRTRFVMLPDKTAVMEMAEASGLKRLGVEERFPWKAGTAGTGDMLLAARNAGAQKIWMGIGGSATNDGGFGMATVLGFRFWGSGGNVVDPVPENFEQIVRVTHEKKINLPPVVGLCDVRNPLVGRNGATAVYGPQKGVAAGDVEQWDRHLGRIAGLVAGLVGKDFRSVEGSGAAGGLGFGLLSFCGAQLEPGFESVAGIVRLEEKVRQADLVVTGEGGMDRQTLEGKTAIGVARMARHLGKPVFAFVGKLEDGDLLRKYFDDIIPLVQGDVTSAQALQEAAGMLEAAASRVLA